MTDSASFAAALSGNPISPRSKMLDVYAADIAGFLTEGRFESAERLALAIPHIAVALSDAALQSSHTAYLEWCSTWIHPDFGAAVYQEWCSRSNESGLAEPAVPFSALRALRLGRRAREVHTRFATAAAQPKAHGTQTIVCALLGAEFKWYEQQGRYQSIVQTNLARLGVLR
jgi:hypothetical protein